MKLINLINEQYLSFINSFKELKKGSKYMIFYHMQWHPLTYMGKSDIEYDAYSFMKDDKNTINIDYQTISEMIKKNFIKKPISESDIANEINQSINKYWNETVRLANSCGVKTLFPKVIYKNKTIFWKVDEPREIRHADEYDWDNIYYKNKREKIQKWENIFGIVYDELNKIASKYGFDLDVAAHIF